MLFPLKINVLCVLLSKSVLAVNNAYLYFHASIVGVLIYLPGMK